MSHVPCPDCGEADASLRHRENCPEREQMRRLRAAISDTGNVGRAVGFPPSVGSAGGIPDSSGPRSRPAPSRDTDDLRERIIAALPHVYDTDLVADALLDGPVGELRAERDRLRDALASLVRLKDNPAVAAREALSAWGHARAALADGDSK